MHYLATPPYMPYLRNRHFKILLCHMNTPLT